ncbi:MAG: AglZ/HisF2 family acetamidino modification protein [Gemmatimonadota bacterium]
MLRPRIIPCLLVHKGGLVKTTRFAEPKYVGDPLNAVKLFNEKEADELMVLDIDATREGALPDFTRIGRLAVECRMPLCYGGGVQSAEQASRIIALGVEKVALSAAAIERPTLLRDIAREIGSQSVVVVIDVRTRAGTSTVWTHNGTRDTGLLASRVAERAEAMGAGEIVINSIDRDGTMTGYDLALARQMRAATTLPLTILGGAGSLADIGALFSACGVVGAAAGSLFVFKGTYRAVLLNYPSAAQKDELGQCTLAIR